MDRDELGPAELVRRRALPALRLLLRDPAALDAGARRDLGVLGFFLLLGRAGIAGAPRALATAVFALDPLYVNLAFTFMTDVPFTVDRGVVGLRLRAGRMTAMAARTLGYSVHVLDPDANCAASPVADRVVAAPFDDADAAADLARHCDVVTLEIEHIGVDALAAATRHAPMRPSGDILAMVQDRSAQKRWLAANGFPIGAYREIRRASDLERRGARARPAVRESESRRLRRSQPGARRKAGRRGRRVDVARRAALRRRAGARRSKPN